MNEVHDVQPGHIYQPGNKKEVRLVYRILSGPYCGRHQKSFSLTKWGVAGAWDAAQQAKAYMLQTGRLPPSFASPYSRSKLTNSSANAIALKSMRPPTVPGAEGLLSTMDFDGSASALFPSLAAFSATTKPPDASLGLTAFAEGGAATFPSFLPSPQPGYQRINPAPGWIYPSTVQATLEATARAAASPPATAAGSSPGAACFHGQPSVRPPPASCTGQVPTDLFGLQMLSGSPHFPVALQRNAAAGGGLGWIEGGGVQVRAGGGDGNVSSATAAATALTLLQLAEQNAMLLQPKDPNHVEPNTLQQFLLLQQFQLLQENQHKEAHPDALCSKNVASTQGFEQTLPAALPPAAASAADASENARRLGCSTDTARVSEGRALLRESNPDVMEQEENKSPADKEGSLTSDGIKCDQERELPDAGLIRSPVLLGQERRAGESSAYHVKTGELEHTEMDDTLRSLLLTASLRQRQQKVATACDVDPQNGAEALQPDQDQEGLFKLHSLASLLPPGGASRSEHKLLAADGAQQPIMADSATVLAAQTGQSSAESTAVCHNASPSDSCGHRNQVPLVWGHPSLDAQEGVPCCNGLSSTSSTVSPQTDSGQSSVASSEPASGTLSRLPESLVVSVRAAPRQETDAAEPSCEVRAAEPGGPDGGCRVSGVVSMSPLSLPGRASPLQVTVKTEPSLLMPRDERKDSAVAEQRGRSATESAPSPSAEGPTLREACPTRDSPTAAASTVQACSSGLSILDTLRRGLPSALNAGGDWDIERAIVDGTSDPSACSNRCEDSRTGSSMLGPRPSPAERRSDDRGGTQHSAACVEHREEKGGNDREYRKRKGLTPVLCEDEGGKKRGRPPYGSVRSSLGYSSAGVDSAGSAREGQRHDRSEE
ncbi:ap2 domain transcription factor ap2viii-5 [Cystoisospora suis]|uniref:Ap2 domain transcription factor ap2viii-5 n=1 Tax=Cystoisospora suis TaxID=483139 RepID=A0A2C6LHS1_9APIC|nr:ap2 domain transcription factor ap2viii-5 [Cystoisospora suis]